MDRRAFLAGASAGLLAAPLRVEAEQPGRVCRVAVLPPPQALLANLQ